jgi:hypothetical protein
MTDQANVALATLEALADPNNWSGIELPTEHPRHAFRWAFEGVGDPQEMAAMALEILRAENDRLRILLAANLFFVNGSAEAAMNTLGGMSDAMDLAERFEG